ncbi:MAG: protein tyrosine phosphatase family protein [Lacipirellulaceae bacterium]
MFRFFAASLTVSSLLIFLGCSGKAVVEEEETKQEVASSERSAELKPVDLGAAEPAHVVGQVYLAGQPSEADMPQLKSKGIKTIVNLRTEGEIPWDEKAAVEGAGMKFVNIPFKGEEQLTDEVFDEVRAVLKDKEQQPVLLHCGSSNRVGAVWMTHRVLDGGLGIEEALEEAKTAGLRSEGYQKKAEAYIERNR